MLPAIAEVVLVPEYVSLLSHDLPEFRPPRVLEIEFIKLVVRVGFAVLFPSDLKSVKMIV